VHILGVDLLIGAGAGANERRRDVIALCAVWEGMSGKGEICWHGGLTEKREQWLGPEEEEPDEEEEEG